MNCAEYCFRSKSAIELAADSERRIVLYGMSIFTIKSSVQAHVDSSIVHNTIASDMTVTNGCLKLFSTDILRLGLLQIQHTKIEKFNVIHVSPL